MKIQRKYFCILLLMSFFSLLSCQHKKKKDIEGILVTAKYCYNSYSPSYYFEGSDSIGVNIYFAGKLFNNTPDTLYIPDRQLKFLDRYDVPIGESLFYGIINGDSLFFTYYYMGQQISPNGCIDIDLQYYITPEKPELLSLFKNIAKDHTILDTMRICFATPDIQLDKGKKLLPPIVLDRSTKFRVDTARYNSYFEQIFKGSDFEENPSKELLEKEKLPGL